MFKMPTATS